jgi:hypothetical protein
MSVTGWEKFFEFKVPRFLSDVDVIVDLFLFFLLVVVHPCA